MATKRWQATRLKASDSTEPQWCMLMPRGVWARSDFPGKKFDFTPDFLGKMVANWERHGSPALPVDYHHEEQAPASGWIEDLDLRDDGLYGLVKWTDSARAKIKADEYRHLSPTWAFDSNDRNDGNPQGPWLFGAALLNDPFFDSMPRVAASAPKPTQHQQENTVNKTQLCALLGIAADSTDEQIDAAVLKANASKGSADAATQKLTASLEVVKGELTKASERVTALEAKNAELVKAGADAQLAGLCKKLEGEGRIIAADKEQVGKLVTVLGFADAEKLTATWPVKVKIGEHGTGAGTEVDKAKAGKEFLAKVDELIAKGVKVTDAYSRVQSDHPDLAAAFRN